MSAELALIGIALIAGFALALLIDRRATGALLAGEALLFGLALSALLLVFLPWTRTAFVIAIVVITIALYVGALRVQRTPNELSPKTSVLSPIVNILTVLLLGGYALFATAAPLWEFDFLSDWGLKAREFFFAKGIDWHFLQTATYRSTHADYPPLLPLTFDASAVLRGAWSDRYLGVLFVAIAAALLLVVYRIALEDLGSTCSAAFVAFAMVPLAASPWIGIAEAPFAAYATTALLLFRKNATAAGAAMLGLAALTKNEGAALIVSVAIALIVAQRVRDLPRLWPAIALPLPWWVARAVHHLPTDITAGNVFTRIAQHLTDPEVFAALVAYRLGKPLFWIGLLIGVLLTFRTLIKRERFVLTALFVQLVFYIGAYLATPHDVGWHVRWSWERLIAHLTPALTFVVLVALLGRRDAFVGLAPHVEE